MPFYAWECLTIQFKRRDLDIVIRDELQMEILIKFLITETNGFDGNRNSLDFLKHGGFIKKNLNAHLLMNDIYKGYRLMKIRMKISYQMALQQQSFQEVWLTAIIKAYLEREKAGLITNPYPPPKF